MCVLNALKSFNDILQILRLLVGWKCNVTPSTANLSHLILLTSHPPSYSSLCSMNNSITIRYKKQQFCMQLIEASSCDYANHPLSHNCVICCRLEYHWKKKGTSLLAFILTIRVWGKSSSQPNARPVYVVKIGSSSSTVSRCKCLLHCG